MATYAGEKPILLIKKLGGLVLLLFGVLLTASAYKNGSSGLGVLGMLLLAGGVFLLALKIVRRNQSDQL
jgi:hypothetical protein